MIDGLYEKRPRRHVKDLNIVPILDMLTTVIFFLLMSTSFLEFTKHTVPPSQTKASASVSPNQLPLTPKLMVVRRATGEGAGLKLVLSWGGEKAGESTEQVSISDPAERRTGLLEKSRKLASDFSKEYPAEKTLQLGLGAKVPYQDLISVMDGVRDAMPDLVLISPIEAEARAQ